ncbi:MAG: hypothetical protein K6F50_04990 [Kiritimatiellae bacterium]|nr:hypothetical protein [Kiritimatiellia bacterium]
MYWEVTYRDKTGKTVDEYLEAESRGKLFAELSSRGISAIRVEQSNAKPKIRSAAPRKAIIHIAVAAVVCAAVLCFLFVFRDSTSKRSKEPSKDAKVETTPQKSTTDSANKPVAPRQKTEAPAETKETAKSEFPDGRILTSTTTNGMYIVEMYRMPDGKKLKKYRYSTPSIWKSSTDQLLHMALATPPGVVMPPLPIGGGNLTKEFEESLKTPIVINPDDNEEVREAKERIIEARETVKKLLAEGYSFEDILADHEAQNAKDAQTRQEVIERIEEFKREGDIDNAREYMTRANEILRNAGITEIQDRRLEEATTTPDLNNEEN